MPPFHSHGHWCYQTMWPLSGESDYPDGDTMMAKYGAESVYSVLVSLVHVIWTEESEAQEDAAHRIILSAKP